MAPPRAVLFDIGDTLFGREGGHRGIVEEAAALGVVVAEADAQRVWAEIQAEARTPGEIAKGRDLSAERHREMWTALYGAADVFADGLGRALYEREIDPDRWIAYTDTEAILEALHAAGVPLGIVSDTGWDYRFVLQRHGWLDLFGSVVLSYEHGAAKPAPALFVTACAQLGVDPSETLMVGDNALTDGGAIAVGLRVLLLPPAAPGGARGLDLVPALVGVTG
jgi:HAD superfamily hydrolase (TIGR01509 family)